MPANPFNPTTDPDRHTIWQMLIIDDSEAFLAADFSRIESDFDAANFEGLRCAGSANPDDWHIFFPTLAAYRSNWEELARKFATFRFADISLSNGLYARCSLTHIDINGDRAVAHKKFAGELKLADGTMYRPGHRQTLYRLHRQNGKWKIVGFLGQLPLL